LKLSRLDKILIFSGAIVGVTSTFFDKLEINAAENLEEKVQELQISQVEDIKEFRGIYLTPYTVKNISKVGQIIERMKNSNLNTVVIDVKGDSGEILHKTDIELAKQINAYIMNVDIEKINKKFHENNIYTIARIVAFKDIPLAKKRPDLAVLNKHTGNPFEREKYFVDPYSEEVQRYNIDIALEVLSKGFNEIQFDYMRTPAKGGLNDVLFTNFDGRKVNKVIEDFLKRVREEIKEKYPKAKISIDVFGFTIVKEDMKIGQILKNIAKHVDYISPMLYPSHYSQGNLGFKIPDDHPYELIYKSNIEALRIIEGSGAKLRPWIQGFAWTKNPRTLKFDKNYILEQIRGTKESNTSGYIIWNEANNYRVTWDALEKK